MGLVLLALLVVDLLLLCLVFGVVMEDWQRWVIGGLTFVLAIITILFATRMMMLAENSI